MASTTLTALDGLVSLARLGRTAGHLEDFLAGVTETAASTIGFRVAALNLYRPADDDYIVTSVVGSDDGQRQLIGTTVPGAWTRRIFTEAFEVERVYFVPAGSGVWDEDDAPTVHHAVEYDSLNTTDPWHTMDALMAPLVSSAGDPLGFISFDEPIDGRRPTPRRLKALTAVAAQVAITIEQRQGERATAIHSAALTHLVGAASSLAGRDDEHGIIETVAHVLRTSLGFGHVVVMHGAELATPDRLEHTATQIVDAVRAQVTPRDSSFLLTPANIARFCPDWLPPRSPGEGPRAWGEHLVVVPLSRADGSLVALLRLAEPADRLLPSDDRLALVGLLAAQTSAALDAVAQSALRNQRDRAVHLARHDETTGLPNRRALEVVLEQHSKAGAVASLIALGLDDFAIVREALGHDHGEATLRAVALRLERLTSGARVHRLDGDVLALLVDGTIDAALLIADRCAQALLDPFEVAGTEHRIGATIGIAALVSDASETLRHADVARLHARRERRPASVYDATIDDAAFRLARVSALRAAPSRGELELHFQPIVDARTQAVAGLEALVRWRHGGRLIPPLEFIGLAEQSGLIERVGAWVIDAAAEQARQWLDAGLRVPAINVNVAPRQLRSGQLAATIEAALRRHDLPASALIAEITESGLQPDARVNAEVEALRALGVRMAVDDFGADYSSLGRLRELPVSILKVDRAFLRDVPADPRAIDLVHAIMGLASALGLQVVVEGVEHEAQAELLATAPSAVLWQGFLRSRPLPAGEIAAELLRPTDA